MLKVIKTPDLARAVNMSIRNMRRYESGEMNFKFIQGAGQTKKHEEFFHDAKLGLLVETLADPKINETLLEKFECAKTHAITNSFDELQRLAKVGELIGSWYFNDDFKTQMVK